MRTLPFVLSGFSSLLLAACATRPPVEVEGLALKRVVIYRNGVAYFERQGRLARCRHGLVKRATSDLDVRVVGRPARPDAAARLLPGVLDRPSRSEPPEVEILFLPGSGRFTGRADCNVLVVLEDAPAISRAARRAHLVIADKPVPGAGAAPHFPLDQFAQAMDSIA